MSQPTAATITPAWEQHTPLPRSSRYLIGDLLSVCQRRNTFPKQILFAIESWQCCGSRPFWYGFWSCFSLWYGPGGSSFSIWYGSESGSDCFIPDSDPYGFKEVMYLKWYVLYIITWFSLSVGPTGPTQKVFFVKFSLLVNFFVLIIVAYGSGS